MNTNQLLSETFVDALARSGLRHVCIAPGSRSTPLALAFAAHPKIQVHIHLDERCASFFALGLAYALRETVAMLCTSGSAAANFFPAIVEARMSHVPLLVLTADRPHELRHSGANQTIDQIKMFGDHVVEFAEMPLPEAHPSDLVLRYVRSMAARALAVANGTHPGPTHLNFPFRKPLEPSLEEAQQHVFESDISAVSIPKFSRGMLTLSSTDLDALAHIIAEHERGVIVCGPRCDTEPFPTALMTFAQHSGYPVFADALSGLRFNRHDLIETYDTFLPKQSETFQADVIIRFGAVPTSSELCAALSRSQARHRIHVLSRGVWADDDHRTTWLLQADPAEICRAMLNRLPKRTNLTWLKHWRTIEEISRAHLKSKLESGAWFDGAIAYEVLRAMPDESRLFVGNSLSVRHLDAFGFTDSRRIEVFGNRGASGIDGNVSTALGIAAANPERPLVALIGDITAIHDMNGLLAINRLGLRQATIVVLNNNGGGIFHQLPIAKFEPLFTELFLTPHGLNFEYAAKLNELRYACVENLDALREQLNLRFTNPPQGAQLIEARTDSRQDFKTRKTL